MDGCTFPRVRLSGDTFLPDWVYLISIVIIYNQERGEGKGDVWQNTNLVISYRKNRLSFRGRRKGSFFVKSWIRSSFVFMLIAFHLGFHANQHNAPPLLFSYF